MTADVWEGSMLGVQTIVKVIGLTSPAATRRDNHITMVFLQTTC